MRLIDRQPLREESSEVWTPDGVALVKPFQIVVTRFKGVRTVIWI